MDPRVKEKRMEHDWVFFKMPSENLKELRGSIQHLEYMRDAILQETPSLKNNLVNTIESLSQLELKITPTHDARQMKDYDMNLVQVCYFSVISMARAFLRIVDLLFTGGSLAYRDQTPGGSVAWGTDGPIIRHSEKTKLNNAIKEFKEAGTKFDEALRQIQSHPKNEL